VVRRTEVERITREVRYTKCGRKGTNTVFIPESVVKGRLTQGVKKQEERRSIWRTLIGEKHSLIKVGGMKKRKQDN